MMPDPIQKPQGRLKRRKFGKTPVLYFPRVNPRHPHTTQRNSRLDDLCESLTATMQQANDTDIGNWFISHANFDEKHEFTFSEYVKKFGNIVVDMGLESIFEEYKDIKLQPDLRPYQAGWNFEYNWAGRLTARGVSKKGVVGNVHYDNLAMVGGLFTLFRTRLGHGDSKPAAKDALRPVKYQHYLRPLTNTLGTIGYVVIMPKDVFDGVKNGKLYEQFLENDGTVIPFYQEREEFRDTTRRIIDNYDLRLREGNS